MSIFGRILDWLNDLLARIRELIRRLLEWLAENSGGGGPVEDIPACCNLAVPEHECDWVGDRSNFTCPDGHHRQWWTCCEGSQLVYCAECTTNADTCWVGSFECSIWWTEGERCS